MILLIDNYDSFSYNLYQMIGAIEPDIRVIRNDEMTVNEIRALKPERIILSPGPGRPEDAGVLIDVVKELGSEIPILGVCLGHQAICMAFGATVTYAKCLMHGKQSEVKLDKDCLLFQNCPEYDFSHQLDLHIIHYACAALGGVCALPKVEQKSKIDRILNDEALKRALQNRPARHIPVKLAIQLLCMQYRCTRLMCLWLQRREHYA